MQNSSLMRRALLGSLCIATAFCLFACYDIDEDTLIMTKRASAYPILDIILHRWSPRAMSGEPLSEEELMTILEAGRWAPSSYNNQPWHFIYGIKGTQAWDNLLNLLVPFNQSWVKNSGAIVCLVAAKNFFATDKPSRTHLFDAGAAWENIALQAASMELVCHGMEGFDYEKAQKLLQVPSTHEITMIFALGKPAPASKLPPELAQREEPSDRLPLKDIISEGIFESKRIFKNK